jgi:hypothetical protein
MAVHRIARDNLDVGLRALVRGGEQIDALSLDDVSGDWLVVTTDRFETRPRLEQYTAAVRLGVLSDDEIRAIESQPGDAA